MNSNMDFFCDFEASMLTIQRYYVLWLSVRMYVHLSLSSPNPNPRMNSIVIASIYAKNYT